MPERYPSSEMQTFDDDRAPELPGWVFRELRRPVTAGSQGMMARRRIMQRVHAMAARRSQPHRSRSTWRSRRGLASLTGLAAAACLGLLVAGGAMRSGLVRGVSAAGAPVRDTIQGVIEGSTLLTMVAGAPAGVLAPGGAADQPADSLRAVLLRDTLRLVRFVLVAPTATRMALVGDFNGWDRGATPMLAVAESTGTWEATVALRPGSHRYAFVQDDSRWVADSGASRVLLP